MTHQLRFLQPSDSRKCEPTFQCNVTSQKSPHANLGYGFRTWMRSLHLTFHFSPTGTAGWPGYGERLYKRERCGSHDGPPLFSSTTSIAQCRPPEGVDVVPPLRSHQSRNDAGYALLFMRCCAKTSFGLRMQITPLHQPTTFRSILTSGLPAFSIA